MIKHAGSPVRAGDDVALRDQIACIKRELAYRRKYYPLWVERGRMQADLATRETWHMQAVLDTLNALAGTPTAIQPEIDF